MLERPIHHSRFAWFVRLSSYTYPVRRLTATQDKHQRVLVLFKEDRLLGSLLTPAVHRDAEILSDLKIDGTICYIDGVFPSELK